MRHYLKDVATSVKLEIRLHAHPVGTNTRSGTEIILRSSDWLMRSELGYIARSLISGVNGSAATLSLIVYGVNISEENILNKIN